jgi:hypothetical protein
MKIRQTSYRGSTYWKSLDHTLQHLDAPVRSDASPDGFYSISEEMQAIPMPELRAQAVPVADATQALGSN